MNRKIILSLCFCWIAGAAIAQLPVSVKTPAEKPAVNPVRIVDSLTSKERSERNPLLLRSELDSLISVYAPVKEENKALARIPEKTDGSTTYILAGLTAIFLVTACVLLLVYRQQKHLIRLTQMEKRGSPDMPADNKTRNGKRPVTARSLEEKIGELNDELFKIAKEKEGLSRVISEYNGIQHEYESLKQGLHRVYKVKNYPGYDHTKDVSLAMQGVLDTENALAHFAYEKFLKPVLAITDSNKNSPAKMSVSDREKLLDLLLSLSLLYIEYLYLRVSDLAVGGTIVERIRAFAAGNPPDPALLKKLNTESGSRALVIKMALGKVPVSHLSYPVFDETNLNNQ